MTDYAAMDDATLVRLAATQVMGWKTRQTRHGGWVADSPDGTVGIVAPFMICGWCPLASDADAFALVDTMLAKGFSYTLIETPRISSIASCVGFIDGVHPPVKTCADSHWVRITTSRARSITIAALMATDPEAQG